MPGSRRAAICVPLRMHREERPVSEAETPVEPAESKVSASRAGRIALAAAAGIALVAGGIAVWRNRDAPPAAAPAATAQPSVDEVITKLEARLKANPQDAESWRMLGWSYYRPNAMPKRRPR